MQFSAQGSRQKKRGKNNVEVYIIEVCVGFKQLSVAIVFLVLVVLLGLVSE